jgi:hypothetical protein
MIPGMEANLMVNVDSIKDAIAEFYRDQSRSRKATLDGLKDVAEELEIMIDSLSESDAEDGDPEEDSIEPIKRPK